MNRSKGLEFGVRATSAVGIAGIAATVAWSIWFVVQPPPPVPFGVAGVGLSPDPSTNHDMELYLSSNPFGAMMPSKPDPVDLVSLKDTRLDLTLVGIFRNRHVAQDSTCMISANGRDAKVYKVGDKLPGFATLVAIHPAAVELEREGVRELLRFKRGHSLLTASDDGGLRTRGSVKEVGATMGVGTSSSRSNKLTRVPNSHFKSLAEVAEEHRMAPKAYLREMSDRLPALIKQGGLSPVSIASARGYRFNKESASPALKRLGLREGDIILSINGKPLGSQSDDKKLLDRAFEFEDSASLQVQRGDRTFKIKVPLK